MKLRYVSTGILSLIMLFVQGLLTTAKSASESNIAQTKHNLSVTGPGSVSADIEDEICVFCHTPHGATSEPGAPLWNRSLSSTTYTTYLSSSIDADLVNNQLAQPAGSSKLCLSCHDGTLAVGTVNVKGGQTGVNFNMSGTDTDGTMPPGAGAATGFTADLGTNLTNDHPISLTYDAALANRDGELRVPDAEQKIPPGVGDTVAIRNHALGIRPLLPLEPTGPNGGGQIQCATCHDPHIRDTQGADIKFLRSNRFQIAAPSGGAFNENADIICLACHDKDLNNAGWANSAHANTQVAGAQYKPADAAVRDFPASARVWETACLSCHDTHTVSGARRLAREGTDSTTNPKSSGGSAIEETCYQCHTNSAASILSNGTSVPELETALNALRHSPITTADQPANLEIHDIGTGDDNIEGVQRGRDFIEDQDLLGKFGLNNRHAECTDCHNPHRVIKNTRFDGNPAAPDTAGTHLPGGPDGNIASGVLRGSWGVEPNYGANSFLSLPLSYSIKRGLGGGSGVSSPHLTREYQLCFKCHSDYAYLDNNIYPQGSRPNLGSFTGGTQAGTNNIFQYTNQAMEFQAPLGDKGEFGGNHRSWHPVVENTGRDLQDRSIDVGDNPWLPPFDSNVGSNTMYCSDCHGPNTGPTTIEANGGVDGEPLGPHGSNNDFILKGSWDKFTGGASREPSQPDNENGLCFKCHDFRSYAHRNGDNNDSGFSGSKSNNLHAFHTDKIRKMQCSWCHIAVPHGWKNKAFLVNLNDVGAEAGLPLSTEIPIASSSDTFNVGPYYNNAKLKIINFKQSGDWEDTDCGSVSNEPDIGKDWMKSVCENPP